jgi:hypothetical protein
MVIFDISIVEVELVVVLDIILKVLVLDVVLIEEEEEEEEELGIKLLVEKVVVFTINI